MFAGTTFMTFFNAEPMSAAPKYVAIACAAVPAISVICLLYRLYVNRWPLRSCHSSQSTGYGPPGFAEHSCTRPVFNAGSPGLVDATEHHRVGRCGYHTEHAIACSAPTAPLPSKVLR